MTFALSFAPAEKVDVPAEVGVPEIWPPAESESPAGSVPDDMDHVLGGVPPVAANEAE